MQKDEHLRQVADIGARYEARIRNQVDSINRNLAGGTYDSEMEALHIRLAEVTAERDQLKVEREAAGRGAGL